MEVTVSVRHMEFNESVKQFAIDTVNAAFDEFRLKISKANIVLDMQRNLVKAALTVSVKDNPVSASSEAYDNVYKAIEEAVAKAAAQTRKYLDRKQDHNKAQSIKECELGKAEAALKEEPKEEVEK